MTGVWGWGILNRMRDKHDQEHLDALRERLYSRGEKPKKREHFELANEKQSVPTSWSQSSGQPDASSPSKKSEHSSQISQQKTAVYKQPVALPETAVTGNPVSEPMKPKNKRKAYRIKLLLAGVFFFVAAVGVSSFLLISGGNAISGDNILINIEGPFTIGGGEILPLQIDISNHNAIPIESATLIVEYPLGTQSADGGGSELFTERLSLDIIASGQTANIPLQAQVFGEENSELAVNVAIEYRVKGSNAIFFKEAEPLLFKINSSPVIVSIDAVRNVASGQETDIAVTIKSNAPATLEAILVKAEYPTGFDYSQSRPDPSGGQNTWLIDKLEPEESKTIIISGVIVGNETDEYVLNFSVGVPNQRDRLTLASVFAKASTEFLIEQAFLDVGIIVNNIRNNTATIKPNSQSNVSVEITNTLSDSIYDGVVKLVLSGNALSDAKVLVSNGHYDSSTNTIVWDISAAPELEQIVPGDTEQFSFSLTPSIETTLTPQIDLKAEISARRVSESQVQEEIVGTVKSTIKVASDIQLVAVTGYNTGSFNDTGPVPPVAGQPTTYTVTLSAENGSNDISDAVMTATLPSYVTWANQTFGDGTILYNSSTRELEWSIGSLDSNAHATSRFQVSILPSVSQIGTTPTLIGIQRFRAEDDFADTVVRTEYKSLTTRMPTDSGYEENNGNVRSSTGE